MRAVYETFTGNAWKLQFSLPLQCPFIEGVGLVSVPQLGRRDFFNLRDRLIIAYILCENDKCLSFFHHIIGFCFISLLNFLLCQYFSLRLLYISCRKSLLFPAFLAAGVERLSARWTWSHTIVRSGVLLRSVENIDSLFELDKINRHCTWIRTKTYDSPLNFSSTEKSFMLNYPKSKIK